MMMIEEWRDIEGYEGLYQVSNTGRVKSLDRIAIMSRYGKEIERRIKGRLLKAWIAQDYFHVTLCKRGKIKAPFVHKLVAAAFIDNPNKYKTVNHKDENKKNNRADNLEWCTTLYNRNYGTGEQRRLLAFMASSATHNKKHRSVISVNKKDGQTKRYNSISDATKDGFTVSCVVNCCKGKLKSHKGHIWRYENVSE